MEETIVAPATGPGEGAIAIVRMSGPRAEEILGTLFRAASGHDAREMKSRHLTLGAIVPAGGEEIIDEAMAVIMRAPHSYTGEDVVEFNCHGGRAVVGSVLEACVAAGARLAQPGEFSRRAFMNGRLDLAQAEAVADLIAARTRLAQRLAVQQLRGGLSRQVGAIRSRLLDAAAQIEARLDFPEEEMPLAEYDEIGGAFKFAADGIGRLLRGAERGRMAKEGARVVLTGEPNVGKSSLFNALIGRERAIVTLHPGTTRDTIESTVDLAGIPVTLVDTAGVREARDEIERIGIERAQSEIESADLVLSITDAVHLLEAGWDLPRNGQSTGRTILVVNKCDMVSPAGQQRLERFSEQSDLPLVLVSAVGRTGLDRLESAISAGLAVGGAGAEEPLVASLRHAECLRAAFQSLSRAAHAFREGLSGEFVMVDLRAALEHLGEITGETIGDDILDRIFSTFCLGK